MDETKILDLLNNGSQDELMTLPGIGPVLANRLIGARPFDSLEMVQTVNGVSANMLKGIPDAAEEQGADTSVPASDEPEPEHPAEEETPDESPLADGKGQIEEENQGIEQSLSEQEEGAKNEEQAAPQSEEILPDKSEATTKSHSPLWTILVSSAITAFVTLLLTLAVLGGINGSLRFAKSTQIQRMEREASQLSAQVDTFQGDLDSLRGRVDILEDMGDRTAALETAQQQLTDDLETARGQVTNLQNEITSLNDRVTSQEEQTQRFETFLKDLQTMLDNLFAPQGGSQ